MYRKILLVILSAFIFSIDLHYNFYSMSSQLSIPGLELMQNSSTKIYSDASIILGSYELKEDIIAVLASTSNGTIQTILTSKVLVYPNPVIANNTSYIWYKLNQADNIKIYIYAIPGGRLIKEINCMSGMTGGQAGDNRVYLDLVDAFGNQIDNGLYIIALSKSDGTYLQHGRLTILR